MFNDLPKVFTAIMHEPGDFDHIGVFIKTPDGLQLVATSEANNDPEFVQASLLFPVETLKVERQKPPLSDFRITGEGDIFIHSVMASFIPVAVRQDQVPKFMKGDRAQ